MTSDKIQVFSNGAAIMPKDTIHQVEIDGEEPIEEVEATDKNIKKHFKDHKDITENKEAYSNRKKVAE